MKAILRAGAGLLGLLLAASVSFGYVLVSPVFRQPYPQAPDMYNSTGYYLIDSWGRLTGPYYNLRPPCQPFGGMLPGKTGQAIMSGNVPHTLLLSKEGLAIGQVPLVGQKNAKGTPEQSKLPGAGLPEMGGPPGAYFVAGAPSTLGPMSAPNPNLQIPYGRVPNMQMPYGPMPYPMPNPNMQMPYGAAPMPYPMPNPNTQVPYTQMPYPYNAMPYRAMPASMPYPMPYGAAPMPYPMPMQPRMPMAYYPMSNGNYAQYYDPRTGISQAQNVTPGAQPFMPIPGFGGPGAPMPPGGPGMDMGAFQLFNPMQQAQPLYQLNPLDPMQRMTPPMMQMEPMQLPRMDYAPPPPVKVGGNAYPTHPFVRSPRDFFMWGENMEDEERMRRRPFPVP
jgi:hypothetical protein